ncbi:MAG: hypothetical protein KA218_05105, partial [Arenimonas sp.]|nr:hypothetical protein [Arenimonas sp.]
MMHSSNLPPLKSRPALRFNAVLFAFCMAVSGAAIAADGDSAKSHLEKALADYASGDYAGAILEFETILQLDGLPP